MDDKELMPIPSFYFNVEVDDVSVDFQEVSGLEARMEVEDVVEGGNNRFKLRLPVRQTFGNITLAKGLIAEDNAFYDWVTGVLMKDHELSDFGSKQIKSLKIHLMSPGPDQEIVRSWMVQNAYPVKWSVSNLNAMENKIAIESVELAFEFIETQ